MTKICLRLKAWLADHQLCSCSEVADLAMSLCKLRLATGSDNSRISVLSIWKLFLSLPLGWIHVGQRGAVYRTDIRGPRSILSSCGFHVVLTSCSWQRKMERGRGCVAFTPTNTMFLLHPTDKN